MKKLILHMGITVFVVIVAFLFMECNDAASTNNDELVDGFLVRVNQKPGTDPGTGTSLRNVTVSSIASDALGSGNYVVGQTVTIDAGTAPIIQPFEKWTTTSPGVTFADDSKVRTSFTMPANNVTVTAVFWTYPGWGTVTDTRDGKKYKTTTIDGKTWMAENLNYSTSNGSWCFNNDKSNCDKYGRLYDWNTAKVACLDGWHLPSIEEWDQLEEFVGEWTKDDEYEDEEYYFLKDAGKKLKAKDGWYLESYKRGGTDDYGFSAISSPVGEGGAYDAAIAGLYGYWWTATKYNSGGGDLDGGHTRYMRFDVDYVGREVVSESEGLSVRCVKNN